MRARYLFATLVFSCAHGRNELSGPDADRIHAAPLEIDTISDDTVNVEEGDATDWRFLDLAQQGTIELQLHWDDGRASLSLELYDALGKQLSQGEALGQRGRQVRFDVPSKDRYYVKVEAQKDDASPYSLKATFQKRAPKTCHDCTVGQQLCVGKDGFAVCEQTKEGCNAWVHVLACEGDQTCKDGACVAGCTDQCKPDERRCASESSSQICVRGPGGCLQWDVPAQCSSGSACEQGKCKKSKKGPKQPPPEAQPKDVFVTGRIITMYSQEGKRILHIEIGEDKGVTAGMSGMVLEGDTADPVPNGQFKVVRVTGKFCIAETGLDAIGNNRVVKIKVR